MISAGILPPLLPCSAEELIYSVNVSLPAEVEENLQRYASENKTSWTVEISRALTLYHEARRTPPDGNEQNVAWVLHQMRELCPPTPMKKLSAKQRDCRRRRIDDEIKELRAAGDLGNLILSPELYEFVRTNIEAGAFATPSEMVTAALSLLRAKRAERSAATPLQ